MALQPSDLKKPQEDELKKADALEKIIDAEMLSKSGSGATDIYVEITCNERVFQELQKRYHGWNIRRDSSCRNESYMVFSPKTMVFSSKTCRNRTDSGRDR